MCFVHARAGGAVAALQGKPVPTAAAVAARSIAPSRSLTDLVRRAVRDHCSCDSPAKTNGALPCAPYRPRRGAIAAATRRERAEQRLGVRVPWPRPRPGPVAEPGDGRVGAAVAAGRLAGRAAAPRLQRVRAVGRRGRGCQQRGDCRGQQPGRSRRLPGRRHRRCKRRRCQRRWQRRRGRRRRADAQLQDLRPARADGRPGDALGHVRALCARHRARYGQRSRHTQEAGGPR